MSKTSSTHRSCVVCCRATEIEPYCQFGELDYVKCRQCGLIYIDRLAGDADMRSAYTGGWARRLRRRLLVPFRQLRHHRHFDDSMQRARRIFGFAASFIPNDRRPVRFLDIGCNKGFLLAVGIEHDADVYGIELVREIMLPFCNTYPRLRQRIYSEKLSRVAPALQDDSFDLITAIDVVEHFEDPVGDMRHIHRLLRTGGIGVIQTPDAGCEQARQTGCAWGALKPLEHLHLFSRRNFTAFAQSLGFREVVMYEPFEHADGNFVAVLRK